MAPICGGTLIAPSVVLTAAHCYASRLRTVEVGREDRQGNAAYESFDILRQIVHPQYRSDALGHDVMLLILDGVSRYPVVTLNRDPSFPTDFVPTPVTDLSSPEQQQQEEQQQEPLYILGFGVTQLGGLLAVSASPTLQIGQVQAVSNSVCEQAPYTTSSSSQSQQNLLKQQKDDSYQGKITNDMMCAQGDGVDACQGDSGSALIYAASNRMGASAQQTQDVQVGITSWGFRCAHPDFPGVYARVSYFWDWIAQHVCDHYSSAVAAEATAEAADEGGTAPAAFKCPGTASSVMQEPPPSTSSSSSSSSSTSPLLSSSSASSFTELLPQKLIAVTLTIMFDGYASEIGWTLTDDQDEKIISSVPFDTYANGRLRAIQTFFLLPGQAYTFRIEDSYHDGLSPGNYLLTAAVPHQEADGQISSFTKRQLLFFGHGDFGAEARHTFTVPTTIVSGSSNNNNNDDEAVASLQTQIGVVSLHVILQLDNHPTETGWILERVGFRTEVVARMAPGNYRFPMEEVVFSLDLEEDEFYRFTILDANGNGLEDGGRVRLFLDEDTTVHNDDDEASTTPIFDHEGAFGSSLSFAFLASMSDDDAAMTTTTTELSSSSPPSQSLSPEKGKDYELTLELRMDLYPEEIGFQIRVDTLVGAVAIEKRASNAIFSRPPGYYNASHTNQIVREQIVLPYPGNKALQHFTLVMMDAYGDGLCCDWQGRMSNTGYTLYRGDGRVVVTSTFASTAREVFSFTVAKDAVEGSDTGLSRDRVPVSVLPLGQVVVRFVLHLDSFPEQTGYFIVDVEGRNVVKVAPGTYRDKNVTVVEDHILATGIYTLSVVDTNEDGIAQRSTNGALSYRLLLVDNLTGSAIVAGDGNFLGRRDHTFVLEGDRASVPVMIRLHSDNKKPANYGFKLERLDLAEADALVAMVAPGQSPYMDNVTGSFVVQDGGLYRLSLVSQPNATKFRGSTRIAVGSHKTFQNVNIHQEPKFLAGPNGVVQLNTWDGESDSIFLSLSTPRQIKSHELDWVLVSLDLESWGNEEEAYTKRTVLAYGPNEYMDSANFENEMEMIALPQFDGKQAFMFIISHSLGTECCAEPVSSTGLIQLYQGLPEEKVVLVGTSFDGGSRVVEYFNLVAETEYMSSYSFWGTASIVGAMLVMSAFLAYKMWKPSSDDDDDDSVDNGIKATPKVPAQPAKVAA